VRSPLNFSSSLLLSLLWYLFGVMTLGDFARYLTLSLASLVTLTFDRDLLACFRFCSAVPATSAADE
jgi:hypothetical protein